MPLSSDVSKAADHAEAQIKHSQRVHIRRNEKAAQKQRRRDPQAGARACFRRKHSPRHAADAKEDHHNCERQRQLRLGPVGICPLTLMDSFSPSLVRVWKPACAFILRGAIVYFMPLTS